MRRRTTSSSRTPPCRQSTRGQAKAKKDETQAQALMAEVAEFDPALAERTQVVAVSLFDLWNNGQIGETGALGVVWLGIMTVFSLAFFVVARRYQLPIG